MGEYLAHISTDGRVQPVKDHLAGTAELSGKFASAFNSSKYGYYVGMMHDIGKCTEGFQRRLRGGPRVDHSTAGAIKCAEKELISAALAIAGHHAGLQDFGNTTDCSGDNTLIGRIKHYISLQNNNSIERANWQGCIPDDLSEPHFNDDFLVKSLWTRMIFSALVDADFLDTERFMSDRGKQRGEYDSIDQLCVAVDNFTKKFGKPKSQIDLIRAKVLSDCIDASKTERGLFSLTVPTGGGKTISSLAFALNHAKENGLDRVIYVIPYTSIIEQNAEVFRTILGNNVIEHHFDVEFDDADDYADRQKLATENWDAPLIVTTAVQFFESLYSNKPSKCRKLHNIANSVIIFDEVQSLPTCHLWPCSACIGLLVEHFRSSVVLCSATQPMISDLIWKYMSKKEIKEISRDVERNFEILNRVTYRDIGLTSKEALADELSREEQVLCIVNTRKAAKELFALLPAEGSFHLSTLMMPVHRKNTIEQIRRNLSEGKPCRVVATSLIEAGVDIDFPKVYREITGVDSIVQAAGRCNREGKRNPMDSVVSVYELQEFKPPQVMQVNIGATREATVGSKEYGELGTIDRYFSSYRSLCGEEKNLDKTRCIERLRKGVSGNMLPFETVAKDFHLIDSATKTIYIVTTESKPLIGLVERGEGNRALLRKLGRYGVNVYDANYIALLEAGDIQEIAPGVAYLINDCLYSEKTGLSLEAERGKGLFE